MIVVRFIQIPLWGDYYSGHGGRNHEGCSWIYTFLAVSKTKDSYYNFASVSVLFLRVNQPTQATR